MWVPKTGSKCLLRYWSLTIPAVWAVINREGQPKQIPFNISHLKINNEEVSDPDVISIEFNAYFTSIVDRVSQSEKPRDFQPTEWKLNYPIHV